MEAWAEELGKAPLDLTKMRVLTPLGAGAYGKVLYSTPSPSINDMPNVLNY